MKLCWGVGFLTLPEATTMLRPTLEGEAGIWGFSAKAEKNDE